jgi:hypothetical protein
MARLIPMTEKGRTLYKGNKPSIRLLSFRVNQLLSSIRLWAHARWWVQFVPLPLRRSYVYLDLLE